MARTITLAIPDWPGHVAGQHVDVRLTASDGYSAVRSYSIATAPNSEGRVGLTVVRLPDGEVSPYLTQDVAVGDRLEVRGPIGGWFVWHPQQPEPIQLIAGGSGIVPLMAMTRSRASAGSTVPFRLLYSVREPGAVLYHDEPAGPLKPRALRGAYRSVHTIRSEKLAATARPYRRRLDCEHHLACKARSDLFVCGSTAFVENAAALLSASGNKTDKIRTERFGPTGDRQ